MSKYYGQSQGEEAKNTAGTGLFLSLVTWLIFVIFSCSLMKVYTSCSLENIQAQQDARIYGQIVCSLSIGVFLESNWTKVLQSQGDMKTPMIAQIIGAVINIIFDWLLIFGIGIFPRLGIVGAAIATIIGQSTVALITGIKGFHKIPNIRIMKKYVRLIYKAGIPMIIMNALGTIYIVILNLILASFSDDAVTILGLYYKIQMFFLIPVMGLTTCIVPILSYNYAAGEYKRCKYILWLTIAISAICMAFGTLVFEWVPTTLLKIFIKNQPHLLEMGAIAFRIIGVSFIPIAISLVMPTFFQAIGMERQSIFITVLRQLGLLIPLAWIFSLIGLNYVWLAFPIAEFITSMIGYSLYRKYAIVSY